MNPEILAKGLMNPQTPLELVTLGIYTTMIAPTEEQSMESAHLTASFMIKAKLTTQEIDTAKAIAMAVIEMSGE